MVLCASFFLQILCLIFSIIIIIFIETTFLFVQLNN